MTAIAAHPYRVREAVARVVAVMRPTRVHLFGSYARGTHGPSSDVDLLVVLPDDAEHRVTLHHLRQLFATRPYDVDGIVVTESQLRDEAARAHSFVMSVLAESVPVYLAPGVDTITGPV